MPRLDAFRHAVARPDESSLHDLSDVSWEAWNDSYRAELDQHKIEPPELVAPRAVSASAVQGRNPAILDVRTVTNS